MGVACFQLEQIPDLSLNKYQSLADTGIEGVLKRHESFLNMYREFIKFSSSLYISAHRTSRAATEGVFSYSGR